MAPAPLFDRVAVIGLGLIGSSIARGARAKGLAREIVGCDGSDAALQLGLREGFIGMGMRDAASAVTNASLVVFATPPLALGAIARAIASNLRPGAIVMDVASVKQTAVDAILPALPPDVGYVPAHPIAGSEHSGGAAGRADLFFGKKVILCPLPGVGSTALPAAGRWWEALGAQVEHMPAATHDLVYAYMSHLPQLLAYMTAAALRSCRVPADLSPEAARALRLAASDTPLWSEIFYLNKKNIISILEKYLEVISHINNEVSGAAFVTEKGHTTPLPFLRIAAAALVQCVSAQEHMSGMSLLPYGGTGWADMTSPAAQAPEKDLEQIMRSSKNISELIVFYYNSLTQAQHTLQHADAAGVRAMLTGWQR